jgi:hypothetical protein
LTAPGTAVAVEEGPPLEADVNRFGTVEKTGKVTSVHRPVALDVTQQESVAFTELSRQ